MSWAAIQGKNTTVKFYTGIPTTKLFLFVANLLKQKHREIHYYSGNTSSGEPKRYQISPIKLFFANKSLVAVVNYILKMSY